MFAMMVAYSTPKTAPAKQAIPPADEEPAKITEVARPVPRLVASNPRRSASSSLPPALWSARAAPRLSSTSSIWPIGIAVRRSTAAPSHRPGRRTDQQTLQRVWDPDSAPRQEAVPCGSSAQDRRRATVAARANDEESAVTLNFWKARRAKAIEQLRDDILAAARAA
jgi:hypothetical protein